MNDNTTAEAGSPQVVSEPDYERYVKSLRSRGLSAGTAKNYRRKLETIFKVAGDPQYFSPDDCSALKESTFWTPLAHSTRRQYLNSAKHYFAMVGRHDLINGPENGTFWMNGRNPAPTVDDIKELTMPRDRVDQLMRYCEAALLNGSSAHERYRCFMAWLAGAYGIRAVGISNLRVCDIDLDDQSVFIPLTKNGKNRRIVMDIDASEVFPKFMEARKQILWQVGRRHPELKAKAKEFMSDARSPLFFIKKRKADGTRSPLDPLASEHVSNIFRGLAKQLFGRAFGPHSCRHAKAFYLLEHESWKPTNVMTYLGHEDLRTTLKYAPLGLDEQRAELERRSHVERPATEEPTADNRDELKAALKALYQNGMLTIDQYVEKLEAL